jgi:hypothetical protein
MAYRFPMPVLTRASRMTDARGFTTGRRADGSNVPISRVLPISVSASAALVEDGRAMGGHCAWVAVASGCERTRR